MSTRMFTFGQAHMTNFPLTKGGRLADYWVSVTLQDDDPRSHREVFIKEFTSLYCPSKTQFAFEYTPWDLNAKYFPGGCLTEIRPKIAFGFKNLVYGIKHTETGNLLRFSQTERGSTTWEGEHRDMVPRIFKDERAAENWITLWVKGPVVWDEDTNQITHNPKKRTRDLVRIVPMTLTVMEETCTSTGT